MAVDESALLIHHLFNQIKITVNIQSKSSSP